MAETVLVLLSASCVSSNKFESVENTFTNNDSIKILNTAKILLNEEQQQSIPIENPSQFCNGSIVSFLLQSETEIDFDGIQKSNKLSKTDIFKTKDPFFLTKLKQIFFPQKPAMEQTLIICNPSLNEEHLNEIAEELKLKGIFVLFQNEISSENKPNIKQLFTENNDNEEKEENISCTAILCESFGCLDEMILIIGCNNNELLEKHAPNSWNNRYSESNYKFVTISDVTKIESFVGKIESERTLALIKPTAVSKGYGEDIINEIKQNEFTIIAQKRIHLKLEHAQYFYKEHEGKPFFGDLTSFMSSGPIYAFILERIGAIKCWRTLLGPTNTFSAKEKASQSLRARYGTDQTANACHGSDSLISSEREIKFYFPEISITLNNDNDNNNNTEQKQSGNIVEEYMSQKLENNESLKEFLIRGLSELSQQKPGSKLEVVEWFGHWLLDNNPNKPQIEEPNDINIDEMGFIEKCKYLNGNNDLQIIFILGAPGSGKGTQCKKIEEKYGFIQINSGDLCKKVMNDKSSPYSSEIAEIMENGKLISSELLLNLLKDEMINLKGYKYLLNEFPRSLEDSIMFEQDLTESICSLNFVCNDNILTERCLKRAEIEKRIDENKETIQKQLETFHIETDPIIEYLKSMNKIKDIDANNDVDTVWNQVINIMDKICK